jgi:hypothetical protein
MTFIAERPVGIFYEHPVEFNPLLNELTQRDIAFDLINPKNFSFGPEQTDIPFSLIFNDLTTPLGIRRDPRTPDQLVAVTRHLELNQLKFAQGRIVNGSFDIENFANRARQLSIFSSLNLPFPKTRIVNSLDRLITVLSEFKFPVLIKPNNAWAEAPVLRYDSLSELVKDVVGGQGPISDGLLLVQEYHQPKNDHIVRVDTLNGQYLSAQRIYTIREPLPFWGAEHRVESFVPSAEVIEAVESIVRAARIDIGSVEYFTDSKTNQVYFYSIRPHSNSRAADGIVRVQTIADYFERRLAKIKEFALAL